MVSFPDSVTSAVLAEFDGTYVTQIDLRVRVKTLKNTLCVYEILHAPNALKPVQMLRKLEVKAAR